MKSLCPNAHCSLIIILYYREVHSITEQCTATACTGEKKSVDFTSKYFVLTFCCCSYILHHNVNVCSWDLEGLLKKGEILHFYYGTNILLKHFSPPTERLNWNTWIYHFFFLTYKRDKEGLEENDMCPLSSYLSQRNNMRLEKMWMPCAEASPALVQTHRECCSTTCPLWDDATAEVHENQGPGGQYWLCKTNWFWTTL